MADGANPARAIGPEPEAQEVQPVVRPKVVEPRPAAPAAETQGAGAPAALGEWWHSTALANLEPGRVATPGLRAPLMDWRERRLTGEEEEEWSYSTAPRQYMMDVLRDRFREVGYQDTSSWPRRTGEDASWRRTEAPARYPDSGGSVWLAHSCGVLLLQTPPR